VELLQVPVNPMVLSAPVSTTTYWAMWQTPGCSNSSCVSITINVIPAPIAPARFLLLIIISARLQAEQLFSADLVVVAQVFTGLPGLVEEQSGVRE